MLIGIFYFMAIVLCPIIYHNLLQYFDQALTNIKNYESIRRFHNYIFVSLQASLMLSAIDFLVAGQYILELLFAMIMNYFLFQIYDKNYLYQLIYHKNIYLQILCIISLPILIMNIVRNCFDTYTIGFMIFNLNNIGILLWEVIILSLFNLGYLFNSTYHNNMPFIIIMLAHYFLKIIF